VVYFDSPDLLQANFYKMLLLS